MLALALLLATAEAAPPPGAGPFGLGLGGGFYVSGISGKAYFGDYFAMQAVIGGWGFNGFGAQVDALLPQAPLAEGAHVVLGWNFGAGGGFGFEGGANRVAVNGVAGLELELVDVPVEIVVEYRPGIGAVDDRGLVFVPVNFSGHLRWFF